MKITLTQRQQMLKQQKVMRDNKDQELGLYLTPHAIMGFHDITHFLILGARGRGKTVISLDAPIACKRKYGYENVKIFYFRISDLSCKAMLANKGAGAVDPILVRKYGLEITTKNNIVYDHGKELFQVYPLVSAAKVGKGVNLYDANFLNDRPLGKDGKPIKRFIFLILDEFLMAEGVEKKTAGDPVAQWKIYLEAVLRDQEKLDYDAVRCFYLANSVSECANFTGAMWNFIPRPGDFGIKKLTRKHTIVWNVPNSQAYYDKRSKSYTSDVMDYENDPNYTNVVMRDLDTIMPKRHKLEKVTNLLMFSKNPQDWFCIYDGMYVRAYRGESVADNLKWAMRRHNLAQFDEEVVRGIFDMYDARCFKYADILSQASFSAQMRLLKQK